MLADTGYDSNEIKDHLKINNIIPIIRPNNRRRNKNKKKKHLTRPNRKKYKRRIKVEHYYGTLKKYSKVNCVYEKKNKVTNRNNKFTQWMFDNE